MNSFHFVRGCEMMAFKCFDDHDNEVGFENRDFNLNPCPHNIALTLQCSGGLQRGFWERIWSSERATLGE